MNGLEDRLDSGSTERLVPGDTRREASWAVHRQRYEFCIERLAAPAKVLDLGCGAGYGSEMLAAEESVERVIGVDIDSATIQFAKSRSKSSKILWLQDDGQTLGKALAHAPFDLICCLENLEHVASPENALAAAARLLSPSGKMISSVPCRTWNNRLAGIRPDSSPANPYHLREYDETEFRTLLGSRFRENSLYYQAYAPQHRQAALLLPVLNALWCNPFMRLGRLLQRFLKPKPYASLDELLPNLKTGIFDESPGEEMTMVFLAVSSKPRQH